MVRHDIVMVVCPALREASLRSQTWCRGMAPRYAPRYGARPCARTCAGVFSNKLCIDMCTDTCIVTGMVPGELEPFDLANLSFS